MDGDDEKNECTLSSTLSLPSETLPDAETEEAKARLRALAKLLQAYAKTPLEREALEALRGKL